MFMSGCQLLPMEPLVLPAVLVPLVGPLWLITLKALQKIKRKPKTRTGIHVLVMRPAKR